MAFLGPYLVKVFTSDPEQLDRVLKLAIGFALLFAAATYALRLYLNLRAVRSGGHTGDPDPKIRVVPTLLVGMLGGLLVGVTSVGSGSVIMIALLMLYPGLSAVKLVGTDLVQAVPLVLAAAIANIAIHGLDWSIAIPLIVGSVPGTILGSKIAPRVPQSLIRRGIVVVLTMSGVALLDKAGWAPLGREETYPALIGLVGLAVAVLVPDRLGLPAQGAGAAVHGRPDRRRARQLDLRAHQSRTTRREGVSDRAERPASRVGRAGPPSQDRPRDGRCRRRPSAEPGRDRPRSPSSRARGPPCRGRR